MADGYVRITAADEFRRLFPDVATARLGLREQKVLGQAAFVTYFDSEGNGEPWENPDRRYGPAEPYRAAEGAKPLNERELAAISWLEEQETFGAWS